MAELRSIVGVSLPILNEGGPFLNWHVQSLKSLNNATSCFPLPVSFHSPRLPPIACGLFSVFIGCVYDPRWRLGGYLVERGDGITCGIRKPTTEVLGGSNNIVKDS